MLVARSCLALDREDFAGFLQCCTADFRYAVRVWSPELRRQMTWLAQSRTELEALFGALPEHLRRRGTLLRHLGPTIVDALGDGEWRAVTSVVVFHTDAEGRTRTWVAGRYHDRIVERAGSPLLAEREVELQTRDLGAGSHVPL
jgi:methanesulfonate monooxygenase small subunit